MKNNRALNYFKGDELAANVWSTKYAYKGELSPDEMHMRMAEEFAKIEEQYILDSRNWINNDQIEALSNYGQDTLLLNEEELPRHQVLTYLVNKYYGLFQSFKYIIPQGSVMASLGTDILASLSNCFVIASAENSYGGIFKTDEEQVQLMKRRGGVGHDISNLQPANTPVNNAAKTSTGAVSFMHRFSNSTREVAQNGRRGALMLSMDVKHPDILDFIKMKRDRTSVTGANISVKLHDGFMEAVEDDTDFILRFPIDLDITDKHSGGNYNELIEEEDIGFLKKIKAKELWNEIVYSAKNHAEPGILFWDRVIDYSPDGVYPSYSSICTNPCGEIPMQAYDACRLLALNLYSFVEEPFTKDAWFNYEKLYEKSYEMQKLLDNLVDLEVEHIDRIIHKVLLDPEDNSTRFTELHVWRKIRETALASRRTGGGFTALGDTLAALGMTYGSNESLSIIEKIMYHKMRGELDCTIDLAILREPFEGWDKNKEFSNALNFENNTVIEGNNPFYQFLVENYPKQVDRMLKYGRRNLSWSTVAPTGSVSILAQTTSGIEPMFQPYYMRRKKINPSDKDVKVDFVDDNGDSWQEFPVLHEKFKDWIKIDYNHTDYDISCLDEKSLESYFFHSPYYKATANDIDWKKRIKIQSIIQKYTTHSISSTINLPKTVTEKEVSDIYMEAWKQGLKGVTVYVDGSRDGVLINNKNEEKKFNHYDAPKRPRKLNVDVHTTVSNGIKYNVFVGILDGNPYEVFITEYFTNEKKLVLKKIKRGRYDLLKDDETYSEHISSEMTDEQEAITRLVSTALRHGAEIKFIVEQLQKTSSEDMFSFTKSLARVLKKYIPDGSKSTITCIECGSEDVIFEEGCNKCLSCGYSACN